MGDPKTDQINAAAPVERDEHSPLTIQPPRSIEEQDRPKAQKSPQAAKYELDTWERMSFGRKSAAVGFVGFWLILASSYVERPAEFLVGSALAVFVALIALNQYYVSKRQWSVMERGLDETERLLQQNKAMIEAAERQANTATAQASMMREQLTAMREAAKQTDKHFGIAERAYVMIETAAFPTEFQPQGDNLVNVVILNGGRTPAMGVTITAHGIVTDKAFEEIGIDTIFGRYRFDGPALLVPDKPTPILTKKFITIDYEGFRAWQEDHKNLFIQIAVNYQDIQEVDRVTYYWYEFTAFRGTFDVKYSKIGTYGKPDPSRRLFTLGKTPEKE